MSAAQVAFARVQMRKLSEAALVLVACAAAVSLGVWVGSGRDVPPGAVARRVDPQPTPRVSTTAADVPMPVSRDALIAYQSMRNDANPKPRLQLIDEWARHRTADDGLDLLTQAMVDPDESVRERAQTLFDREIALPPKPVTFTTSTATGDKT